MHSPAYILVVDDARLNAMLMQSMLQPLGHRVATALSGRQALDMVRQEPPDLVLLDIMMPDMTGYEVTRLLKNDPATANIPVLVVTSLSEVKDRVLALEAGADDFLSKPVDKTELKARVGSLLKTKAYHDQLLEHQRQLEAEVARRTEQLRQAYDRVRRGSLDTILRLSQAAEYKDDDTSNHIARMSHYCSVVARRMGLGERVAEAVLYAAPMHDVGKIGIPDRILLKPGPLDDAEWEVMRQHTTIGASILAGAETGFLRLAETIALTHHERWDGRGYPRGLQGRQTPLAGRIVAVCDVFDALTSRRPYKEPWPVDKARQTILDDSGAHFDPAVVEAFEAAWDEIMAIREVFKGTAMDGARALKRRGQETAATA